MVIFKTFQQLNNIEIPMDDTSINYIEVNELKSLLPSDEEAFYEKIKETPDKQFYFGMEFKKINNPEFNDPLLYPIKLMPLNKQYYTPQLNNISFQMPDVPLLSQFESVPKVSEILIQ